MQLFNCYEHMFRNYALEFIQECESGFEAENDRTGVGRYMLKPFVIEIQPHVFPMDSSRKLTDFWKYEFDMFVTKTSSDIRDLGKYACVWEPWADSIGSIGDLSYPNAFKQLPLIILELATDIMSGAMSTTHLLTTWENNLPEKIKDLWPDDGECKHIQTCHGSFIHFLHQDGVLNLNCVQRSGDIPLGVPYNLIFYKTLLLYVVRKLNKFDMIKIKPGTIEYMVSAPHFYMNQLDAVKKQHKYICDKLPNQIFNLKSDFYNSKFAPTIQNFDFDNNGMFDVRWRFRHGLQPPSIKYPKAAV